MADLADVSDEHSQPLLDSRIAEIRAKADIPAGVPGDCDLCGEWSGRLVKGACASCRDKYKLP